MQVKNVDDGLSVECVEAGYRFSFVTHPKKPYLMLGKNIFGFLLGRYIFMEEQPFFRVISLCYKTESCDSLCMNNVISKARRRYV